MAPSVRQIAPDWYAIFLERERLGEKGYRPSLAELDNFIRAANETMKWIQVEIDKIDWTCHTEQRLEDNEDRRMRMANIKVSAEWAETLAAKRRARNARPRKADKKTVKESKNSTSKTATVKEEEEEENEDEKEKKKGGGNADGDVEMKHT